MTVKILLPHILSILHIPIIIRGSPAQQDHVPKAWSLSSQVHMVQPQVLAGKWAFRTKVLHWLGNWRNIRIFAAIEQQHPFSDTWYRLSHSLLCPSLCKSPAYHFSGERVVPQHIQAQRQDPEQYQERVVLEDDQKVKSWSQTLVAKFLVFHRFLLRKCHLLTSGGEEYATVLWCSIF